MFALYLTGPPAAGKTTAGRLLAHEVGADFLSYGELLTSRLSGRVARQSELRELSAVVISIEDVQAVDRHVFDQVSGPRDRPVIVDSHAVTAEAFGFRAVPYSAGQFAGIGYTHVACLYAPAAVIHARILAKPDGRPLLAREEVERHTQLQSALALSYAQAAGLPISFVNSNVDTGAVVRALRDLVGA